MFDIKRIFCVLLLINSFFGELDAQLQTFDWAKGIVTSYHSIGASIASDKDGNIYTIGGFSGTADLDPGPGTCNLTYSGDINIFISKLDASGNFVWAKNIGGPAGANASSIILDTLGNIYISGLFGGTVDIDPNAGVVNFTSNGGADIFILKLDVSGNFIWAKQIGGNTNETPRKLALDKFNNLYVTGYFSGTVDFDWGLGVSNLTSYGEGDVFVMRMTTSGNFVWAKHMGGADSDSGEAITVDNSGNVFTGGSFYNMGNYDPGPGYCALYSYGNSDAFISKLDSMGNFIWAKRFGGTGPDRISSLITDSLSNLYISGNFYDVVDFDPGVGVSNCTANFLDDIFILKLDSSGNFKWVGAMGGPSSDNGNSIMLDKFNNVYVAGSYRDTVDFDPGPGVHNLMPINNGDNFFILKLDDTGNFTWVQSMGNWGGEAVANSIFIDNSQNIYTTGFYLGSVDFDPGPGVYNLSSTSGQKAFIHKMKLSYVGIQEIENSYTLIVYPNPTNGSLTISSKTELQKIEVISITGQVVLSEIPTNVSHTLHLDNFANGIYFVNLYQNDRVVKREKIVLNK